MNIEWKKLKKKSRCLNARDYERTIKKYQTKLTTLTEH